MVIEYICWLVFYSFVILCCDISITIVCQKDGYFVQIDLLSASRSNLFSNTLVPYQDELLQFWEKTARTMSAVLESFKGYQHYEFKLLKVSLLIFFVQVRNFRSVCLFLLKA